MDFLSANKIRIHGMKDDKWTTKDKIRQYNGLIKLYKRENKIGSGDISVALKKGHKDIEVLRKELNAKKEQLATAMSSGKHAINNILVHHKSLRLAYRHLPAHRILDSMHQQNFHCRKKLDLMNFKLMQKKDHLINLKLELSKYEDITIILGKSRTEIECGIITGKVQDAILKTEAAISVKNAYKAIIALLRKDTTYYDRLLNTLYHDCRDLSRCIIDATMLGQQATEYLDDRRLDFQILEKQVKARMRKEAASLEEAERQILENRKSLRFMIRRDDDINHLKFSDDLDDSCYGISTEIGHISEIFVNLQNDFLVTNYDNIIPCLVEQRNVSERLGEILIDSKKKKDSILKKVENGREMCTYVSNVGGDSLQLHLHLVNQLKSKIECNKSKTESIKLLIMDLDVIKLNLKVSLQQIDQLCKYIKEKESTKTSVRYVAMQKDSDFQFLESGYSKIDASALQIIEQVRQKLILLSNAEDPRFWASITHGDAKETRAFSLLQTLKLNTSTNVYIRDTVNYTAEECDILSGVCYTGIWNTESLQTFILIPLVGYLILGTIFLLAGFVSLFRIRTVMKHDGTKTDKLEKLMIRIGIFSVLYTVPALIVLGCLFYELFYFDSWMHTWTKDMCKLPYSIPCPIKNNVDKRPQFELFMIKYLMYMIVGITSSVWIWSGKTMHSWRVFFNRIRGRHAEAYV